MTERIVFFNEDCVTVRALAHQIASRDDLTAMVAAIRDNEGRWYFVHSSGMDSGDMAFASIYINKMIAEKVME